MILSFRHLGLASLYERGDRRRIPPEYADKVERILARLDVAAQPDDMDLPGIQAPSAARRNGWIVVRKSLRELEDRIPL